MKVKHKLLSDYQFTSNDKKIFILKSGTILEEYTYKSKDGEILIDRDIIDNNPLFFQAIDWKIELLSHLKSEKVPQPSQIHKKLIPFIEDMILSSIQHQTVVAAPVDDSLMKKVEQKENDLNQREKRIKDREEEIEIRLKRIEKREESYKDDLKVLDKKEDDLRLRNKEVIEKQLDVEEKLQEINNKERNLDKTILESAKDIDVKYADLQRKIEKDLRVVSEKEKDIEAMTRDLKKRESKLEEREAQLNDLLRDAELKLEDAKNIESEAIEMKARMKGYQCQHGGCFLMLNGLK